MLDASKALNASVADHERMRGTLLDVRQGSINLRQQLARRGFGLHFSS